MLFSAGPGRIKTGKRVPTVNRVAPKPYSSANVRAKSAARVLVRATGRRKNINLGISY